MSTTRVVYETGDTSRSSVRAGRFGADLTEYHDKRRSMIVTATHVDRFVVDSREGTVHQMVTIRAITVTGDSIAVVFAGDDVLERLKAQVCYAELDALGDGEP